MSKVPSITLNNGVEIPQFGFGVFQVPPEDTAQTVRAALDAGYRHIDTAQMYRNEEGVGRALAESGLPRGEVFVTTKLANERHGGEEAVRALEESLLRLGTDYVDLYLIHWPQPGKDRYVETWRGLEKVLVDGRARAIGVSNFTTAHLRRLAAETGTVPAVNQVELHPRLPQAELREYHRENGIATEAWSPIAQGGPLLQDPTITDLAREHGRTPAQVVLRWHIQLGNIVFPKTTRPERMRENIDVFGFELSGDDMVAMDALGVGERTGPDPDRFG
jgi:2,5-diketo-D-gluconate reductase A